MGRRLKLCLVLAALLGTTSGKQHVQAAQPQTDQQAVERNRPDPEIGDPTLGSAIPSGDDHAGAGIATDESEGESHGETEETAEKPVRIDNELLADVIRFFGWDGLGNILNGLGLIGVVVALLFARRANQIARQSAERQLRAYVNVEECTIEEHADGFVLIVTLNNFGQTPAYDVRFYGEAFVDEYPLRGERAYIETADIGGATMGPGKGYSTVNRIFTEDRAATMDKVQSGEIGIYAQGICRYRDAFDQPRETRYRFVCGGRIAKSVGLAMHATETGNMAT